MAFARLEAQRLFYAALAEADDPASALPKFHQCLSRIPSNGEVPGAEHLRRIVLGYIIRASFVLCHWSPVLQLTESVLTSSVFVDALWVECLSLRVAAFMKLQRYEEAYQDCSILSQYVQGQEAKLEKLAVEIKRQKSNQSNAQIPVEQVVEEDKEGLNTAHSEESENLPPDSELSLTPSKKSAVSLQSLLTALISRLPLHGIQCFDAKFNPAVIARGKLVCRTCFDQKTMRVIDHCTSCPHASHQSVTLVWPRAGTQQPRDDESTDWTEIRPPPTGIKGKIVMCKHHSSTRDQRFCKYAHSMEEMEAWNLDRTAELNGCRYPPSKCRLKLCSDFSKYGACSFRHGNGCLFAHGSKELNEWRKYLKGEEKTNQPISVPDTLCQELRRALKNEKFSVISENLDGLELVWEPKKMWKFIDASSSSPYTCSFKCTIACNDDLLQLKRVILLPSSSTFAFESGSFVSNDDKTATFNSEERQVEFSVTFSSTTSNSFVQDLLIESNRSPPYLLQTLNVDVADEKNAEALAQLRTAESVPNQHWEVDVYRVISLRPTEERQRRQILSKKYVLPLDSDLTSDIVRLGILNKERPIPRNYDEYKKRFHTLLYLNEVELARHMSTFSVQGAELHDESHGQKRLELPRPIPPRLSKEGYLQLRDCEFVCEVTFSRIDDSAVWLDVANDFILMEEFKKREGSRLFVDFQFLFDRLHYLNLHDSIDRLSSSAFLSHVHPEIPTVDSEANDATVRKTLQSLRTSMKSCLWDNKKQRRAIGLILSNLPFRHRIISGPFGTGKTFLLAESICLLTAENKKARILLCTQTNYCAETYVRLLHEQSHTGHFKAQMIRLCYKNRKMRIPHEHRRYYLLTKDDDTFRYLSKDDLIRHQPLVVVTTLIMSTSLEEQTRLPNGYFTHIIIDEAAQATEPETLAPLALADRKTVLVMAGDCVQTSPPVASAVARGGKLHRSLFRRLRKVVPEIARVDLVTNYRSHRDLFALIGRLFYKYDKISSRQARSKVTVSHPRFHPFGFYVCDGLAQQNYTDGSYVNPVEAMAIIEQVKAVRDCWPEEWGRIGTELSRICIVTSEQNQIVHLRRLINAHNLATFVDVQTSRSVQGREYFVVFVSSVMTLRGYREDYELEPNLFSDVKVVNTVLTRAKALAIVFGDPDCLVKCKVGQTWQKYIKSCYDAGDKSLLGKRDSSEFVSNLRPSSPIDKDDLTFSSDSSSDEERNYTEHVSSFVKMLIRKRHQREKASLLQGDRVLLEKGSYFLPYLPKTKLEELASEEPEKYIRCFLTVPRDSENAYGVGERFEVLIEGVHRRNRSFDGDEVLVEILSDSDEESDPNLNLRVGRVVGRFSTQHPRRFVCKVDDKNANRFSPLERSYPAFSNFDESDLNRDMVRVFNAKSSDKEVRYIPLDEAEEKLFVVEYLQWRCEFRTPLGVVVDVIDAEATLESGRRVMEIECAVEVDAAEEKNLNRIKVPEVIVPDTNDVIRNALTIDPPDAKALDDALSIEYDSSSKVFKVGVYITDVSRYIQLGGELDNEAQRRAVTVYSRDSLHKPMLPERVGVDRCSLLPHQTRHVIAGIFQFHDNNFSNYSVEFREAIIESCCKLTYREAQQIIDEEDAVVSGSDDVPKQVYRDVRLLYDVSSRLRASRLNARRYFCTADTRRDADAHALVEEFMIIMNKEVAKRLLQVSNLDLPILYCQSMPTEEKTREWANDCGLLAKISRRITFQSLPEPHYQISILKQYWHEIRSLVFVNDFTQRHLSNLRKIVFCEDVVPQLAACISKYSKGQQRSVYTCKRIDDSNFPSAQTHHYFGTHYTHFTAPIRRYADLAMQRVFKSHFFHSSGGRDHTYNPEDIAKICFKANTSGKNARKFQQGMKMLFFSSELLLYPVRAVAIVEEIQSSCIILYIPDLPHMSLHSRSLKLASLNASKSRRDQTKHTVKMTWGIKLLSDPLRKELLPSSGVSAESHYQVSSASWEKLVCLLSKEIDKKSIDKKNEHHTKLKTILDEIEPHRRREAESETAPASLRSSIERHAHTRFEVLDDEYVSSSDDEFFTPKESLSSCESDYEESGDEAAWTVVQKKQPLKELPLERSRTNLWQPGEKPVPAKFSREIRLFDVLPVYITARLKRGLLCPVIQLVEFSRDLVVCVKHNEHPASCFAPPLKRLPEKPPAFGNLDDYIAYWSLLVQIESATSSVKGSSTATPTLVRNVEVDWISGGKDLACVVDLEVDFIDDKKIAHQVGDYVCLRYLDLPLPREKQLARMKDASELFKSLSNQKTHSAVFHCEISESEEISENELNLRRIKFKSCVAISDVLAKQVQSQAVKEGVCMMQTVHRSLPFRKMKEVLSSSRIKDFVKQLVLGSSFSESSAPSRQASITDLPQSLNESQRSAVFRCLREKVTLIQGPPGTGKTVTGVHIAWHYAQQNKKTRERKRQLFYCAPSNEAVDVVARRLKEIITTRGKTAGLCPRGAAWGGPHSQNPGQNTEKDLIILRVYGENIIQTPGITGPWIFERYKSAGLPLTLSSESSDLRDIALHRKIRDTSNLNQTVRLKAKKIFDTEKVFARMKRAKDLPTRGMVTQYRTLVKEAEAIEIKNADIILCTCIQAGSGKLKNSVMAQCIVDEAGQCMEPETLVAIARALEKVILIGDHKQLQPVVQDRRVSVALSRSLFERLSHRSCLLDTQYRMHETICAFPSEHFYDGKLKTKSEANDSVKKFWSQCWSSLERRQPVLQRKCFIHVFGREEVNPVAESGRGGEESKYNEQEVNMAVRIADSVAASNSKSSVHIITPYTAQREKLKQRLQGQKWCGHIKSIAETQGGEADFVVLSMVRSLPKSRIR
ncbi:3'-5' exoribonuclease HELZ2-like isoform X4 [Oscarella lobularis]|uniref:3'-5' exoribonuclease HELZ2-like isoform X4 n=1 Tax=Oscarella lobularis TaxID=121494 RepID=UPI003313C722